MPVTIYPPWLFALRVLSPPYFFLSLRLKFLLESLSMSSASTTGGLFLLALEHAHLQPNRTFARGCFPLTQSHTALCAPLEGQQKKDLKRKSESLFFLSMVQSRLCLLVAVPRVWGAGGGWGSCCECWEPSKLLF